MNLKTTETTSTKLDTKDAIKDVATSPLVGAPACSVLKTYCLCCGQDIPVPECLYPNCHSGPGKE